MTSAVAAGSISSSHRSEQVGLTSDWQCLMSSLGYRGPVSAYSVRSDDSPQPGGPCSALAPSMQPTETDTSTVTSDPTGQPDYTWDEFGFRVEEEDGPEDTSSKLLSIPFLESPRRRLQWAVELELGQGEEDLRGCARLETLLEAGVPHSLRAQLWPRLLRSQARRDRAQLSYRDILAQCRERRTSTNLQIEKDLLRTLPTNICFSSLTSVGVPRLRRVLQAVAQLLPQVGYCQGMGMIAGTLLLFCEEEDVFWSMICIIENLLPASYYSSNLWGAQADQMVLQSLVGRVLPDIAEVLDQHNIDLSLISLHWFITIFSSALHIKILVRVWDLVFFHGSTVMFRVALAMLKISEPQILSATNSADIFNILSVLPSKVEDVDELLKVAEEICHGSVDKAAVEALRRKHLSLIMSDMSRHSLNVELSQAAPVKPWNPRRKLNRSKSIVEMLTGAQHEESDERCKNIRRTEMFVFLRESVLRIGTFFQGLEPEYHGADLSPDYSVESHTRDIQVFMSSCGNKMKRARAVLDFERREDDELGFIKNDIITIHSMRDEHCWVGELNGQVGWFPAKFVELVDERSKQYSRAGDDRVNQTVTDLVRGPLTSAIKQMLELGLKRSGLLAGSLHPWQFIVEAATEAVQADYDSVFSRLVLCKTFK